MTTLGKSIAIQGDLTGNEDIVIDGSLKGNVDLPNGRLTIGAPGTVEGQIRAQAVVIVGRVTGDVTATDRLEIQGTGVVAGDLIAPRLVVSEGAIISGSVQMVSQSAKDAAASSAPPPSVAGTARPAL